VNPYISETEFAVRGLIDLAVAEENELRQRTFELNTLAAVVHGERWNWETADLHDDFTPAYVMAAFGRMARAQESMEQIRADVSKLKEIVAAHEVSVQSICGSILQIAKQGISHVHGARSKAPEGRAIGSLVLRDIIWQGRNQSIHYEDKRFDAPVVNCFSALEREQGEQFSLGKHVGQNRAKQVIALLGWASYDSYEADMTELLS
jgi:hypothetical protein